MNKFPLPEEMDHLFKNIGISFLGLFRILYHTPIFLNAYNLQKEYHIQIDKIKDSKRVTNQVCQQELMMVWQEL